MLGGERPPCWGGMGGENTAMLGGRPPCWGTRAARRAARGGGGGGEGECRHLNAATALRAAEPAARPRG